MHIPAHIHFNLWGQGYPLQWAEELKFTGDRFLKPNHLAADAKLGDFRTIQPLTRDAGNLLRCAYRIRLRRTTDLT